VLLKTQKHNFALKAKARSIEKTSADFHQNHSLQLFLADRVTRLVCEKVAHIVAQTFCCQKQQPKFCATSAIFKTLFKGNSRPIREKFAQSGHPADSFCYPSRFYVCAINILLDIHVCAEYIFY
jgi:hypothetical protein